MRSERLWLVIQVLMVIIALAHGLQPLLLPWRPKFVVAAGGGLLYGLCAVGLARRRRWALWIAVIGPLVGTATLSVGALLMALDVIHVPFRQDVYTLLGGLFQVPALVIAIVLLRRTPPEVVT